MPNMEEKNILAEAIQKEGKLSLKESMSVVWKLSIPGILAQISEIAMQYIDAAMVGSLGAAASASIGLVSSSTWLFNGVIMGTAAGFSVQIAHAVGAKRHEGARSILRQGLIVSFVISLLLCLVGVWVSGPLPHLLGGEGALCPDASDYFLIYAAFIPVRMLYFLAQNSLQCIGNMKTPSILSALMCVMDVIFNFFLIFETRSMTLFGLTFTVYGAGLGVMGAALGTALSFLVAMLLMVYHACWKSQVLSLRKKGSWKLHKETLQAAVRIGLPMAAEQVAMTSAQVFSTRIVAPLGTNAIAANSFAVTAESLCYMPGYGIANAATTLVGQSIGAGRKEHAHSFAWLSTIMGMVIMGVTGAVMFFVSPLVFAFLTPVAAVQALGVSVLRIELLAEPLFGASIVASGALRGAGDTFVPGIMNLISIWGVRITLSFVLAGVMGLQGVWIAMAVELCFRGCIFLLRLAKGKWLDKAMLRQH